MNASSLRPTNDVASEDGAIHFALPESSHGLITTALLVVLVAIALSDGIRAYQPRDYSLQSLATAAPVPPRGAQPKAPSVAAQPPPPRPDEVIAIGSPSRTTASTGALLLPRAAEGHRVYVDGRLVGDAVTGMRVACGRHVLKIGSRGDDRALTVPCGSELSVSYP